MSESTQGTRAQFRDWLSKTKHITYTAYSRLDTKAKATIYAEYKPKRRKA